MVQYENRPDVVNVEGAAVLAVIAVASVVLLKLVATRFQITQVIKWMVWGYLAIGFAATIFLFAYALWRNTWPEVTSEERRSEFEVLEPSS